MLPVRVVVPNRRGEDLENRDKTLDAHLRLEGEPGKEPEISADVFDSSIKDADDAWTEGELAANTAPGAREITDFLRGYNFDVTVVPNMMSSPSPRRRRRPGDSGTAATAPSPVVSELEKFRRSRA